MIADCGPCDIASGAILACSVQNGRFCYAMRRAPDRMLWWANGYWHAGLRASVGEQTALLSAQIRTLELTLTSVCSC